MAKERKDLQQAHRRRKKRESVLETLESIVVAFVLAFIFRAFLVEAFVIPTGSMAPTLNGEHVEFRCEDCGYRFAVGHENRRHRPPPAFCPNCGLEQSAAADRVFCSGDRILVLKFLYDFGEPDRWDVMVFRNPNTPEQNYIKRLVGRPGETVELRGGDVTINGRIVQKTDLAQEALWMLVHDTRRTPRREGWQPRWLPSGGWQQQDAGFHLSAAPAKTAWLAYEHRAPDGARDAIRDVYGYNAGSSHGADRFGLHPLTDLCLRGSVQIDDPAGAAVVELRAWKDEILFELTAEGSGRPSRVLLNGKAVAEAADGVLPVGRAVEVLAANVDHKLMLWVDGDRPLRALTAEATPEGDPVYEPSPLSPEERRRLDSPTNRPATVRVGVRGSTARLGYLKLARDVYYVNEWVHRNGGNPVRGHAAEGSPFALREGEYFVLGDNSPKSLDCRFWDLDRPVVPRNYLVGRAFFVYWPAAGVRRWIPLAPNPAGWRFVH